MAGGLVPPITSFPRIRANYENDLREHWEDVSFLVALWCRHWGRCRKRGSCVEIFFCYCQSRAIGDVVRHRRRNTLAAQNLLSARKGNVIQVNGKSATNM